MRISLWVHPRSRRTEVGGERDGALVVRVTSPPEGGRATEEALAVVADAFAVHRRQVALVIGRGNRAKVVDVEGDPDRLAATLDRLLTSGH